MCMVSVVIPYYNRKKTLPRALDSVCNQSCQDFEIILVNDGSTDNSELIVEEYIKQHPEVRFKHIYQVNMGPSGARNTGVQNAKGRYIAFLDSDDAWEPSKLEIQVEYMEKHPDVAITGTNYFIVKGRKWLRYSLKPEITEAYFYRMLFKIVFATPTVLIRSEVFWHDNIWFRAGKNQGEDILLFLQIIRKHRGVRLSKPLASIFKLDYGEEGCLTSDISKLLECERDNLRILYRDNGKSNKKINLFLFYAVYFFYYLKQVKRVVRYRWHKIKCFKSERIKNIDSKA